jgi:hypothetical protein
MMISCKKSSELLCASLDRRLSFRERLQLRMHLALCQACSNFQKQNDAIIEAINRRFGGGDSAQDPELEQHAREACDRIKQRLRDSPGSGRDYE